MKQTEFLRLQLALLTRQHGEHAVLESLAGLRGLSVEDLQSLLLDIEKIGYSKAKRISASPASGLKLESLLAEHPEKADLIRSIKARYDNKTLLSELKEVRRFLDRHGQSTNALKARGEAFTKVARVLVGLPTHELEQMLNAESSNDYSGLGIISDQILGRK